MFSEKLHRSGLWTFFADLLGKHHSRANFQFGKLCAKNAVAMKIYLLAVASEKSEFTCGIKSHHGSDGLTFVALDHSLHLPRAILKPPTRPLERVIYRERQFGMSFVCLRCPSDIDLAAIRQRQADIDVVLATSLVTLAGTIHDDPACRNAAIALLKLPHMVFDQFLKGRTDNHIPEFYFNRRLHYSLHCIKGVRLSVKHPYRERISGARYYP